jgi:hypothetical protein
VVREKERKNINCIRPSTLLKNTLEINYLSFYLSFYLLPNHHQHLSTNKKEKVDENQRIADNLIDAASETWCSLYKNLNNQKWL